MNITLRDTIEADLPALFQIRLDPRVQELQVPMDHESIASWQQMLFGDYSDAPNPNTCTTILNGEEVIGHIDQGRFAWGCDDACSCGWNLAPAYWGQGIMRLALSQVFHRLFEHEGVDIVISDCFANNSRCLRLIRKLYYEPVYLTPLDRLRIMKAYQTWRLVLRFGLPKSTWRYQHRRIADAAR